MLKQSVLHCLCVTSFHQLCDTVKAFKEVGGGKCGDTKKLKAEIPSLIKQQKPCMHIFSSEGKMNFMFLHLKMKN